MEQLGACTYLNGLIDGFLNVTTNIIDLIHTSNGFVRIWNIYGRHIKARSIESWSFAEFLNDLHHYPLPIGLMTSLISLGQVEANLFRMFDA